MELADLNRQDSAMRVVDDTYTLSVKFSGQGVFV